MKVLTTIYLFSVAISFNLYSQRLDFSNADFRKADSVANLYTNHSLTDLKQLAEKLTVPLSTEEEKFRAIYYWVCNNVESDYQYYLLNERQRTKFLNKPDQLERWNTEFSKLVFDRLLTENKTVCTGYAYLIKELSYWAGLTSKIVDGYGRSVNSNLGGTGMPNHSWNAIQLNGKWYLCDATWSSGSIDPVTGVFVRKFDEGYFLPSPALFARNHYPLDTSMLLLKNRPLLHEFLEGPIVYRGAYKYNVNPISPKSFIVSSTKGKNISICFNNSQEKGLEKIELQINGRVVESQIAVKKNGHYCIDHTFKNKGSYIVHALSNSNYLFTYRIIVR